MDRNKSRFSTKLGSTSGSGFGSTIGGGGGGGEDNYILAMLWEDGTPILWEDGSYIQWEG